MNSESETGRHYAIDVICPIGTGLRIMLKNYSKLESEEVMLRLQANRDKFHLHVLIEMASHEYQIYPTSQKGTFEQGEWFGVN